MQRHLPDEDTFDLSRRTLLHGIGATGTASAFAVAAASASEATETDETAGLDDREWREVWSDEFDGDTIDPDTWTFEVGGGCGADRQLGTSCTWGNEEAQYYSAGDNAWVEDGTLVIEARKEAAPNGVHEYTSARLKTSGKKNAKYGRIDVRATLPSGQGVWPALWMLGEDIEEVGWPTCGEIDIVELVGHEPDTVHGTVHGPGYSGANGIGSGYTLESESFAEGPHTFSIVWDPDSIAWYVDGEQYHTVTRSVVEAAGNEWVFDGPFFFIFNVAVGGLWPGYPDESTTFPQQMRVEYVREYEAPDGDTETPTPDTGTATPAPDADTATSSPEPTGEDSGGGTGTATEGAGSTEGPGEEAGENEDGGGGLLDRNGNGRLDLDDLWTFFEEL